MADHLTKEQRRKNMQAVRPKDSKIEIRLAKALWTKGYRYRKNHKKTFGKPDIAFVGLKIAVFCDSEFWHGKDWEKRKYDFKSNRDFWLPKIERNIQRDKEVNKQLTNQGWTVIRFWGKDIEKHLERCIDRVEREIKKRRKERPN